MKWILALVATSGAWLIVDRPEPKGPESFLIVGGDTHGYLSPCGCTKPMSGGIRRRIALMKQLAAGKSAALIENGGLVSGSGAQDQLKAEAIAESLASAGFDAVHLGAGEAKLGIGGMTSILNLLNGIGLSSAVGGQGRLDLKASIVKEPFVIGSIDPRMTAALAQMGEPARSVRNSIDRLLNEAMSTDLRPVLLFQGTLEAAKLLPRAHEFAAIVYSSKGAPSDQAVRFGETVLATPGEKGKSVLVLRFLDGRFASLTAYGLPPDIADDETTSRIYRRYLDRISAARLLEQVPRLASPPFSGSKKCGSCHSSAANVWKGSRHSGALTTLAKEMHEQDPDCVGCHVVGLTAKGGFRSMFKTPQFAGVGCESCHGAGSKHSASPYKVKMGRAGAKSCAPCHSPDHSPGFEFAKYWQKIKH